MKSSICTLLGIAVISIFEGFFVKSQEVTTASNGNGINEIDNRITQSVNDNSEIKRVQPSTTTNNPQIAAKSMSHLELLNGTIISRLMDHGRTVNSSKSSIVNDKIAPVDLLTVSTPSKGIISDNKSTLSNMIAKQDLIANRTVKPTNHTWQYDHKQATQSKILTEGQKAVILNSSGSTSKSSNSISLLSTVLATVTVLPFHSVKQTVKTTTTKRPIYIRGHKLESPHRHRTHEVDSPASMIAKHGYPTHHIKPPCWPDCGEGLFHIPGDDNKNSSRSKRKHYTKSESWKKFNHKVIGHEEDIPSNKQGVAKVYGWIIGAAMLSVGSLISLTGGVLICFCSDKIKKKREERRRLEKYGEYERVESVSSLVSSVHPNDFGDDQLETVSMI